MSVRRPRPRPIVVNRHGSRKKVENELCNNLGTLSPDLQPSPPVFPKNDADYHVSKIGKYFLIEQLEGNEVFKAIDSQTKEEFICKVFSIDKYRDVLSAYWQVDSHDNISSITEIILGKTKAYIFFDKHFGDLHSFVRQKKRLREDVACSLFQQIVAAVQHCHDNGIVLRDLKLRKFVFKDSARTQLRLDGLEDAVVLEDELNDQLVDKHGCPAYVSPEILDTNSGYSGRSADIWSIGVMLYTMLVGRYPFHDTEPCSLFGKIRRGQFTVPEAVSSKPKCLIRSLLRREPAERLTAHQILFHPWFHGPQNSSFQARVDQCHQDQTVPEFSVTNEDEFFS